ncbi:Protein kinase domain [Phytophthora infestans]|uniref:Protein kinase domain n=1 Tax=Phytophthora infestans TaxID=4787 RepID=A0A833WM87_PHYIN|nr:Protein kinase domain [Phytophthora infestans]KAF4142187.1 Protein kinase domain [Phytophthora infestans]KAF4144255.1 Protein kinase domain [Phytophthora infestans]
MKDALSSCSGSGDLALDFPQDEYSLMFPPSPDHSPTSSSSNSCASGVVSPTPNAKSPLSTSINSPEIKTKKWVRKEKIGQGAQGSIYRYVEINTGREVAVKVIWTRELPPPAVEAVKREVKTMKRLRHRHLVRYLQATEKKQSELRIYMEYAAGGSLSSRLSRSGALPPALVKRFTRQLCEALHYLHQNGIAHRDIKCANILLTAPKGAPDDGACADVKLGDFGTFKLVGCASLVGGLKGTPHWMAPEVIRQQNMEDDGNHERWFRADIWSLGCAVLEMITGHSPWQQFSNPLTAMYQIVSSDITPTIPADVPAETASFLMLCLQRNPEHRATLTQLLAHPFIRVSNEGKAKANSSKHRLKRLAHEQVCNATREGNQQGSHSLPSTPKMAILRGKESVPEPEPHEDSSTLSHMESPTRVIPSTLKLRSASYDEDKRTAPSLASQYIREDALGSPSTRSLAILRGSRTLRALEPITKPSSPLPTNQDSLMPSTPTNASRGASAATKRLPRMRDLKTGNGPENPSTSPLRLRRIATAPTTATKLEATEDFFPDSIRLPPLSARPTRNRCSSARSWHK